MAGSVYYFNATLEKMELTNNGHNLNPGLAGIAKSTSYAATGGEEERSPSDHSGTKAFGASNKLAVGFTNGTGWEYEVEIDNPIEDDLQLYIFHNKVVLVSANGSIKVIEGKAASQETLEELQASEA